MRNTRDQRSVGPQPPSHWQGPVTSQKSKPAHKATVVAGLGGFRQATPMTASAGQEPGSGLPESPAYYISQGCSGGIGPGFASHLKAHPWQDLLPCSLMSLLARFDSSRVVGLRASSSFRSLPGGPQGKHTRSNLTPLWLCSIIRSESLGPARSQGDCRGCECQEVGDIEGHRRSCLPWCLLPSRCPCDSLDH